MVMTIDNLSLSNSGIRIDTAVCPEPGPESGLSTRTTHLEDGKIVAAAPRKAQPLLRTLTVRWGLLISGKLGDDMLGHARALEEALSYVHSQAAAAMEFLGNLHLVLLRQNRFLIPHFGTSDVYLIRRRTIHPLVLAPNLQQLEETLGIELPSSKFDASRVACGSAHWPDASAMQVATSSYLPGDFLLLTSPGLFEKRDWPGILGSIPKNGSPFEQTSNRLARLGRPRVQKEGEGYLLLRIDGEDSESKLEPTTAAQERPTRPIHTAEIQEIIQKQLVAPSPSSPVPRQSPGLALFLLVAGLLLLALWYLAPLLWKGDSESAPRHPVQLRRRSAVLGQAGLGETGLGSGFASSSRAKGVVSREFRQTPESKPLAKKPASGNSAVAPSAVPHTTNREAIARPTATEVLEKEKAEESGNPLADGRTAVMAKDLDTAILHFRQLFSARPRAYTIQVGVVSQSSSVLRYFGHGEGVPLMLSKKKDRYYLCIGLFSTEPEAWQAIKGLPEFFRKQNAIPKAVSKVLGHSL